jgi:hypothetical protein
MSLALRFFAVFVLFACASMGQVLSSVSGIVTDPTGSAIPAASLTLENLDTAARRTATADAEGRYRFPQLQPGRYRILGKASGFADVVVNDVIVQVATNHTINVAFEKLGAVAETISVSAEAAQVTTSDATLGNVITFNSIVQLPAFARNVTGLLALQPGVTFVGSDLDYRSGAVNGGKSDQSNITLDGIDINDQQNRYALVGVLRVTPDSVQEVRTTTLNGTADMGRSSGAQISAVTRSGSNDFHMALWDHHRNTATAANSFFRNSSGVPRPALLIDVFGGRAGGRIIRNKLFYFGTYDGRRDRSASASLRIVPSEDLKNGIITYQRTNGTRGQLTAADMRTIDPAGIGINQAALNLLKTYPVANDFTQGDGLNRQGFRFNSPQKEKQDTYVTKFDYIATSGHNLFIRGQLQNDHAGGIPQFPDLPPSTVGLGNSKGLGVGWNAVWSPNLVSTLRWGLTRQGNETSGINQSNVVSFRSFDTRFATDRSAVVIVPTHQIAPDFTWTKGAHNIQFGGIIRWINNRRANNANSFHLAVTNVSWLRGTGVEFDQRVPGGDLAPTFSTAFRDATMALLGIVSQGTANYNYDISGRLLPVGTPVSRRFKGEEYEMYVQDTWKITRQLTFVAGLRYSLMPPVYEADGIQTTGNPRIGQWFDTRGGLAAQGRPQFEVGNIQFVLHNSPTGQPLYPYHKKNFAPRVAIAYSPAATGGVSKWLFGGPGRSSIRAGAGMFYDLFGQGVMRLVADNAFGFRSRLSNASGSQTALTAPRFTGFSDVPSVLLPPAPPGGFPATPPNIAAIATGLDDNIRPPYSMTMNLSISREFRGGWFIEGSYVGRLSRRSLIQRDLAMPTNLRDPASGQTYFEAATALALARRAGIATNALAAIPFWENFVPGAAGSGRTATQNIYANYRLYPNDEISGLYDLDYFCDPACTRFGRYTFFNSQYSALAAWSSIAGGSYHGMQWTLRKRFGQGMWVNMNYTFSKSIDLASVPERSGSYSGFLVNSWEPGLRKAISDYDTPHLFNFSAVYELPFGTGKPILNGVGRAVNALVGGWQISGIWTQSAGYPTGVGVGRVWATNWNITSFATAVGTPPEQKATRNAPPAVAAGRGGPNMFADPAAGLASFGFTLPGQVGNRNVLRGDGMFNVDLGLAKRFIMPYLEGHSLQFRAEAFNVGNNVRFEPQGANLSLGDAPNFGKYTSLLVGPRQLQFVLRYEF